MLKRLSLRARLLMMSLVPLLLLLAVGVIVLTAVQAENDKLVRTIYDTAYHANSALLNAERDMMQARDALHNLTALERRSAAYEAQAALLRAQVSAAEANISQARTIAAGHNGFTAGELSAVSGRILAAAADYRRWTQAVAPFASAAAEAGGGGRPELEYRLEGMAPLFDVSRVRLEQARQLLDAAVQRTVQADRDRVGGVMRAMGAALLMAAAFIAAFGVILIRSVRESLTEVVGIASALAEGELRTERVRMERDPDGFAELGAALDHMRDNLDRLIGSVSHMTLQPADAAPDTLDADRQAAAPAHGQPCAAVLPADQ